MQHNDDCEILLIEDNPNDAELMKVSFRNSNVRGNIVHLKDGVEAFDFLFRRGIYSGRSAVSKTRLILLDIKLPRIDGFEILKTIKREESTRIYPVVVFTSSNEEADIRSSYLLGANSYVVKPLDFKEYDDVIGEICRYWIARNRFIE